MRPLNSEVAEPDQGRSLETTHSEIGVGGSQGLVEPWHGLLELGADATDEEILKRWHPFQEENRPILTSSIALRDGSEQNITLLHGRRSAIEYSGSDSP
jgi:hypothetical protein